MVVREIVAAGRRKVERARQEGRHLLARHRSVRAEAVRRAAAGDPGQPQPLDVRRERMPRRVGEVARAPRSCTGTRAQQRSPDHGGEDEADQSHRHNGTRSAPGTRSPVGHIPAGPSAPRYQLYSSGSGMRWQSMARRSSKCPVTSTQRIGVVAHRFQARDPERPIASNRHPRPARARGTSHRRSGRIVPASQPTGPGNRCKRPPRL